MNKLNSWYWLEADNFFITTDKSLKKLKKNKAQFQLLFHLLIHYSEPSLQLYHDWKFFRKILSLQNQHSCKQLSILKKFVTYRECFIMNTGSKTPNVFDEEPSNTKISLSSLLVFDSVITKLLSPPLNDSKSSGTVYYDAHIKTKMEVSIKDVFVSMTIQELNTLH